jgi:hypothetical protein
VREREEVIDEDTRIRPDLYRPSTFLYFYILMKERLDLWIKLDQASLALVTIVITDLSCSYRLTP